jgi:hypothetical protein
MPDTPDWAIGILDTIRDPLYDLAELAVRLGSPQAYERGGVTILVDDMSNGVSGWELATIYIEGFITLSPRYNYYGGLTMLIKGDPGGDGTKVIRSIPLENVGRWGIELGFGNIVNCDVIDIILEMYTSEWDRYLRFVIDVINRKAYIDVNTIGLVEIVDNTQLSTTDTGRLIFKLIADFDNAIYTQLYFNEIRRNLRDYALPSSGGSDNSHIEVGITITDAISSPGLAYLDYVIITTDEPDKAVSDT